MTADLEYRRTLQVPGSARVLFDWHARIGAFERLAPAWQRMRPITPPAAIEKDQIVEFELLIGPLGIRWVARIVDLVDGERFEDRQIRGPFAAWSHVHAMRDDAAGGAQLEDRVRFRLPLAWMTHRLFARKALAEIDRLFAYRHRVTRADLEALDRRKGVPAMKVVITGGTGLLGSALRSLLTTSGHEVKILSRSGSGARWNPDDGTIDTAVFEGVDAVVHLAGENIAAARWSTAQKERLRRSRIEGTKLLVSRLTAMASPPKVLVAASAIGYFGSRGDEMLDESSTNGQGFLAELCRDWEAALLPAMQKGIRVVMARFGVILSPQGGALKKMLLPFKLGAGGRIGSGKQWMSWIALDDAAGAVAHLLTTASVSGPAVVVAPEPVTNADYTKTLGRVLGRPTIFPMPAFAARLAFGEMADELLLSSQRAMPKRLTESGYRFRFPSLEAALRHLLGR